MKHNFKRNYELPLFYNYYYHLLSIINTSKEYIFQLKENI